MINKISRGEIYVADLNPYQGSEQGGIRPVIILQNDTGNYFSSTTIVASLTSHVGKKENLPTHVFIKANHEYEMEEVEEALSVSLGCFDDSLSINVELHM